MAWFDGSGARRNVNAFGYWRYRFVDLAAEKPQAPATVWCLLRRGAVPTPTPSVIELEWPNGLRLRTTLGVADLGTLVRALSPC